MECAVVPTQDRPHRSDADAPDPGRLLAGLPDAVIVVEGDGTVNWGNPAAEAVFGRTVAADRGMPGLDLVHPEDLELVLRSLESIQTKTVGVPIEIRLRTPTGWRLMELVGSPVGWVGPGAVVLMLRDLTDRRRFEVVHDNEAQFRTVLQNSPGITLLVSPDELVESASSALTRRLGYDPEAVEGRALATMVAVEDRPALASTFDQARQGATAADPASVIVRLLRRGCNETVPFELAVVNLIDDPTIGGFIVSAHDVTKLVQAETSQRNALSLIKATLDATAEGVVVIDTKGRFSNFNHQFVEMWRVPASVLHQVDVGAAIGFVRRQLVNPESFVERLKSLTDNRVAGSDDVIEFTDGRVFEARSRLQTVSDEVVGRVWSFRDVTDRKRLEERLSFQAFHDPLTGLANRSLFLDRLEQAIARSDRRLRGMAVFFVDMDRFKSVNDHLGHSAGDALLKATAHRLSGCLRAGDTAARIGGDEFGIVVEGLADPTQALHLAERILKVVSEPLGQALGDLSTTVSIGIAFDEGDLTADQLLNRADVAMYRAKAQGGDSFVGFAPDMLAEQLS
jgi:diguanylate cyclase (GGDEF)-like protein/PAS domain S-box-containing protein